MKITCPTKHLREVLALTSKGIKKNSPIPSLECVRVTTGEIGIELTATDYEMEVRCAMGCHVEEPGEVILPAKRFLEVIGSFSGADVSLRVEERIAHLKCGRSNFRLQAYSEEMPLLPPTGESIGLFLPQSFLRDMLAKVEYAMGNDPNRPGLNGARFTLKNGKVEMAATDTTQLCVYPLSLDGDDLPEFSCTIPRRTVAELQNFLSRDEDEDVEIVVDEQQIEFRTPFYTIKSRLVAGRAPDYEKVLQTLQPVMTFELDRAALLDTVKRLDILAKEDMHRIRLQVQGDTARFWTQAAGVGDADEELPCQSDAVEPCEVWVNTRQMALLLETFVGNKITFRYESTRRPLIAEPETGPYYALAMPMIPPQ